MPEYTLRRYSMQAKYIYTEYHTSFKHRTFSLISPKRSICLYNNNSCQTGARDTCATLFLRVYKTTIEIVESSPPLFVYIEIEIRILIILPDFLCIATIRRKRRRSQEERKKKSVPRVVQFSLSFSIIPFAPTFRERYGENKFRLKLALIYRGGTEQRCNFQRDFRPILAFPPRKGDFTRADDGIIFRVGVNLKLPGERERERALRDHDAK